MLKILLPVFSGAFVKLAFQAARRYPKECKETRMDVDRKSRKAIQKWMENPGIFADTQPLMIKFAQ